MAALPDYAVATSPSAEEAMVGEESLPLLSVARLSMTFGPVRALDSIDLSVMPGEVVALAGENGAGKSTLLRALAGDLRPTSGEIMFRGRALGGMPGPGGQTRRWALSRAGQDRSPGGTTQSHSVASARRSSPAASRVHGRRRIATRGRGPHPLTGRGAVTAQPPPADAGQDDQGRAKGDR